MGKEMPRADRGEEKQAPTTKDPKQQCCNREHITAILGGLEGGQGMEMCRCSLHADPF